MRFPFFFRSSRIVAYIYGGEKRENSKNPVMYYTVFVKVWTWNDYKDKLKRDARIFLFFTTSSTTYVIMTVFNRFRSVNTILSNANNCFMFFTETFPYENTNNVHYNNSFESSLLKWNTKTRRVGTSYYRKSTQWRPGEWADGRAEYDGILVPAIVVR